MIRFVKHITRYNTSIAILIMVVSITACSDDNFNAIINQENAFKNNQSNTAPIPGNNGFIIISNITEDSAKLQWTFASDNSPPELLQYQVVLSQTMTLFSLQEILQSGLLDENKWSTEPLNYYCLTGLSFGTRYFVNVCVRDPDKNISIYYPQSFTTIGRIYLFCAGTYTGAMASSPETAREEINEIVQVALSSNYPDLPQENCVAFISIDETDAIINFPQHYGIPTSWAIYSPNGNILSYNWYDLLDGTIIDTLQNLGISTDFWWSGSKSDGSCDDYTCNSWTSSTNESNGRTGAHNRNDSQWLAWPLTQNCNTTRNLLGICW